MSGWIEIGRIQDIPCLGARVVRAADRDIAVFRTANDEIHALDDRCPHRNGPLSQGIVHGRRVTCPLHNWVIELAGGKAVPPDEGRATRYPVEVEADIIRRWTEPDAGPRGDATDVVADAVTGD